MHCDISVRVTPRSSQNRIAISEGGIKAWVTAAPTDGQANEAVVKLFARTLSVAPSRIAIVRGETSRDKVLRVEGLSEQELVDMLPLLEERAG